MMKFDKNGNLSVKKLIEGVPAWNENGSVDGNKVIDENKSFPEDGDGTQFLNAMLGSNNIWAEVKHMSVSPEALYVKELVESETDPLSPNKVARLTSDGKLSIIGELREEE